MTLPVWKVLDQHRVPPLVSYKVVMLGYNSILKFFYTKIDLEIL
jgi:hypothetical protein